MNNDPKTSSILRFMYASCGDSEDFQIYGVSYVVAHRARLSLDVAHRIHELAGQDRYVASFLANQKPSRPEQLDTFLKQKNLWNDNPSEIQRRIRQHIESL